MDSTWQGSSWRTSFESSVEVGSIIHTQPIFVSTIVIHANISFDRL